MTRVDVTYGAVLKVAVVTAAIWLAVELKAIIITLLISVIIMSAMVPGIEFLKNKFRFKYTYAIATVFSLTLLTILVLIFLVFPPFINQLIHFTEKFPSYVQSLSKGLTFLTADQADSVTKNLTDLFTSQISSLFGNLLRLTVNVFSGFLTFISIAVFTFYLLLERQKIKSNLHLFIPNVSQKTLLKLADEIELRLGAWVRGQLSLSVIIGITTLVGLNLLLLIYTLITGNYDQNFASFTVSLAIIAGILELVPVIGPILSAVPAVVIAFSQDPTLGFAVIGLYVLIQQLENNLIVPVVMNRAVGLNPMLVLLSLLIGGSLLGVIGTLIAVPVAAIVQIIYSEYTELKGH